MHEAAVSCPRTNQLHERTVTWSYSRLPTHKAAEATMLITKQNMLDIRRFFFCLTHPQLFTLNS